MNVEINYNFRIKLLRDRIDFYNSMIEDIKDFRKKITFVNIIFFIFLIAIYDVFKTDMMMITIISICFWVCSTYNFYSTGSSRVSDYEHKILLTQIEIDSLVLELGEKNNIVR